MKRFNPDVLISGIVGLIFLSEGIQKFLFPESLGAGRFARIGIPYSQIAVIVVAICEIVFGLLLVARIRIKLVVIPLLAIIIGALFYTKYPQFRREGFWPAAHDARTDLLMLTCLLFLSFKSMFK
ncbi:MAG: DoxX family protein [Bacteroidota bacterium]